MRRNEDQLPMRREDRGSMIPWSENEWLTPETMFGASPWQMMRRMQDDMERIFGQLSGTTTGLSAAAGWSPSMDISESDQEWCIEADLPGVDRENVEVRVENQSLILRAELRPPAKEQHRDESGRRYHRQERRYGYFERVLPLPENVKEDAINCEFRNGVLTVHLPKAEQALQSSRRIPVQEGAPSTTPATTGSRSGRQSQSGAAGARSGQRPAANARQADDAMHEEEEEERETAGRQSR